MGSSHAPVLGSAVGEQGQGGEYVGFTITEMRAGLCIWERGWEGQETAL